MAIAGALLEPWSLLGFLGALMALWWACRVLESTLIVPRRLGRALQSQGLRGTTYRFPFGDLKEFARLAMAARAKPMPLSHDITPRVNRLYYNVIREHGKHVTVKLHSGDVVLLLKEQSRCKKMQQRGGNMNFFAGKISVTWLGPTPRVIVNDPKLVREIMANKFGHFQKRKHTGIVRRLANGLVNHEGEKWAAHRKIINPAFHLEKLKVTTSTSTSDATLQLNSLYACSSTD
jgi:cytochrome P450 family 3 subfamily A